MSVGWLTLPVGHVVQRSGTGLVNTWLEVEARRTATTNLSQGRYEGAKMRIRVLPDTKLECHNSATRYAMYCSPLLTLANTVLAVCTRYRNMQDCVFWPCRWNDGWYDSKKKQPPFYNSVRLLELILHLELCIYFMARVQHLMLRIIKIE